MGDAMFGLTRGGNKRSEVDRASQELQRQLHQYLLNKSEDELARITQAIGQATRVIMAKLANMEKKMSNGIDALLAAVEAQQSKIDSLITLTNGLHEQVLGAMGDTITPSQKMRIDAVFKVVEENSADIDAAITANTVDAAKGAISDGPSAAEIKDGLKGTPVPEVKMPGPNPSTTTENPAT